MGEWVRHLEQLIEALAASDRSDGDDLAYALSQARPVDSTDLNNSADRVRKILLRSGLIGNKEPGAPSGGDRGLVEEAAIVGDLARIIAGD